jgi:hypothetical protein
MNPFIFHLHRIPVPVRLLMAGGGLAALLSWALAAPARGPAERPLAPVLLAAPVRPKAESRPVAGPLTLRSLTVGPEPWVWASGQRVVATFVTDDGEQLRLKAMARLRRGIDARAIRWTVSAPLGFVVPVEGSWTGPRLDVVLRRPGGNPTGLNGPLALTVEAQAILDGQEYTARETVVQDEIDQIRQEYIDLERRDLPARSEFLDAAGFAARYGRRYPWLRFEDLNWSVDRTTGLRYSYALIRPELVEGLDRVRRLYGSLAINSGYRNPVRQVEVHAPVRESLHQYGYAADLAVTPGAGRGFPNEVDWRRLAEIACRARAKWVEPLADSGANGPECHVHLDYRSGPGSAAPVRLRGQVLAADTGRPVAGALVLLGGMPARTDARGIFGIYTVLSGGPHPVDVRAEGYAPLTEPIGLRAWGAATARLLLQPALPPALTIAVARAQWIDRAAGRLAIVLRVTNGGSDRIQDTRLRVTPGTGALLSQAPDKLGDLPPGAVRGMAVAMRLRPGQGEGVPLAVDLAFRGAAGQAHRLRQQLQALLPEAAPALASAPVRKGAPAPVRIGTDHRTFAHPARPEMPATTATPRHSSQAAGSTPPVAVPLPSTPAPAPAKEPETGPAAPEGKGAAAPPTTAMPPASTPPAPLPDAKPSPPADGKPQPPAGAAPEETKPPAPTEGKPTGA